MSEKKEISEVNIAVVDDHDLIREGVSAVLLKNGVTNISKYGYSGALIDNLKKGESFDIYIIDLELPDIDGFALIEAIRAYNPMSRIVIITVHDEIWTLRKLLANDVNAIIYKSGDSSEIITAINEVLDGKNYYCKDVSKILKMADDSLQAPTPRELEVLNEIAQGKTSREIAAAMFVSINTIEAHRKSLFVKLGAINVADLIFKSMESGYLRKRSSSL